MTHARFPSDWRATVFSCGSSLFVSPTQPALNDIVTIRLRMHKDSPVTQVILYAAPDGEAWEEPLTRQHTDEFFAYYQCQFRLYWKTFRYHFLVITQDHTVWHYVPGRMTRANPTLRESFAILADAQLPAWVPGSVFYQIFTDRFANGDPSRNYQPGEYSYHGYSVSVQAWGELPKPYTETGNLNFFGGDLAGIQQKLDYLQDLGVNALYLTPIFRAPSNHRYDTQDYYEIDPHVGDEAVLAGLTQDMHARGMRLLLDGVFNHTGMASRWFNRCGWYPEPGAYQKEASPYDEFYTFYEHPDSYECWWGHHKLPKLDFRSQKLRDTIYRKPDSVVQYWLERPRNIDGWRFDVANMTARYREHQLHREVWSELRAAVKARFPQAYLVGEHSQDGSELLQGDCLDGNINFQGFLAPLFCWLASGYAPVERQYRQHANFNHQDFREQVSQYLYAIPWQIAELMFNAINTHDRPRFLTVTHGDRMAYRSALVFLFSFVGVPAVYYGDEVGLLGSYDPDNRRCMPWDPDTWDRELQALYKACIDIRKHTPALATGSFQWLETDAPAISYARFDEREILMSLLVKDSTQERIGVSLYPLGVRTGEVHGLLQDTRYPISDFTVELPPVADIYRIVSK